MKPTKATIAATASRRSAGLATHHDALTDMSLEPTGKARSVTMSPKVKDVIHRPENPGWHEQMMRLRRKVDDVRSKLIKAVERKAPAERIATLASLLGRLERQLQAVADKYAEQISRLPSVIKERERLLTEPIKRRSIHKRKLGESVMPKKWGVR